jgi:hypothetical protein
MSDLIVIGYPDEKTAQNAWEKLVKLEHDYLVDLEDAAIIRRDQKGKLHITAPAHHAVAWGSLSGLFWGVLIGLLFLFPLAPLVGVAGGIMGAALGAPRTAARGLSRGPGFGDLIADLVPRAVTLAGRVMWLCTASSSLVTKRTSERERWTNEE